MDFFVLFSGGQCVMIMVWQQWAGTATTVVNPSASLVRRDGDEDDDDGDDNDGDDDDADADEDAFFFA
jgi:hypothetical protein